MIVTFRQLRAEYAMWGDYLNFPPHPGDGPPEGRVEGLKESRRVRPRRVMDGGV